MRLRVMSFMSKPVSSVTLYCVGKKTLCRKAQSVPVQSLLSSHRGAFLLDRSPQPDKMGGGGGETGRIAHMHPHARRTHTKPSYFPCLHLLVLSYITFSNSCMDLIMVSSCRGRTNNQGRMMQLTGNVLHPYIV